MLSRLILKVFKNINTKIYFNDLLEAGVEFNIFRYFASISLTFCQDHCRISFDFIKYNFILKLFELDF